MISTVLSDRVLYSWQGKDIERKVIFITSTLPEDVDSVVQKSLMVSHCIHGMDSVLLCCVINFFSSKANFYFLFFFQKDAADKCVSVEFAVFQQKSSHLTDTRENINNFRRCTSHLENCSVQTYIPGLL